MGILQNIMISITTYVLKWNLDKVGKDIKAVSDLKKNNLIVLKPLQNKKGQKNLGYPRKKQSFYKEKDCFFLGYPKFFWPFLFWSGFRT